MEQTETKFGNINTELVGGFWGPYDHSFGPVSSGTIYHFGARKSGVQPLTETELRGMIYRGKARAKALTSVSGGTGSTDYVLAPVYVDANIVDVSRRFTPFLEMIPRVTNKGRTADYNRITAKGSAVMRGEDASLSDVSDTYERVSKAIRYLYSVGRVTGQAQAAQPPYAVMGAMPVGSGVSPGSTFTTTATLSPLAKEVILRAAELKKLEEDKLWNGTTSTSYEWDGIVQLQGSTNRTALSDSLGLDDLETAIEDAFYDQGLPDFAGASIGVVKDIRNLLRDTYRYGPRDLVGTSGLPFGLKPQLIYESMIGPIPIIPSRFLDNTSGSKSIYFLNSDMIEFRVLQDMTYEKLGKTNDSDKFFLKIYEVPIIRAPEFNSCITSIT